MKQKLQLEDQYLLNYDKFIEKLKKIKQIVETVGETTQRSFLKSLKELNNEAEKNKFDELIKGLKLVEKSDVANSLDKAHQKAHFFNDSIKRLNGNFGIFGIISSSAKTAANSFANSKFGKTLGDWRKELTRFVTTSSKLQIIKSLGGIFIKTGSEIARGANYIASAAAKVGQSIKSAYSGFKSVAQEISGAFKFVDGIASSIKSASAIASDFGSTSKKVMSLQHAAEAVGLSIDDVQSS